jgi:hypothetical protein
MIRWMIRRCRPPRGSNRSGRSLIDKTSPPMAVFTDLENRPASPPFEADAYARRLPACRRAAERMALVHVTGGKAPFETTVGTPPYEIPTSHDHNHYSDETRRAETLLGLSPSAYFYAGRAHPDFGNVGLAFPADCELKHTGSATPFDTGGLVHPRRYIRIRSTGAAGHDDEVSLVIYGRASEIPLDQWRRVFASMLAAYFRSEVDYWTGRPLPYDPDGLYELNAEWRAWTFEIRFSEGQSIDDRAAWCADEPVMETLRRLLDEQAPTPPGDPPTPLERFLQGPVALEPAGTPSFCRRLEEWVRDQCLT